MIGLVLRSFCGALGHRRIKVRVGDHEDTSSDVTGSIGTHLTKMNSVRP